MWPWPVKIAGRDLRLGPQIAMDSSNIPLRPLWNSQDFTYVPLACGDYKLKKANFHFGTEIQLFWNKRNSFLSMSSVVTWHSGQMVLFCDTLQLSENLKNVFSCPEQLNRWPCHSLTNSLTNSQDFTNWHTKSNLIDFRHFRHLIRVMRRHDLIKKYLPTYLHTYPPTYLPTYVPPLENILKEQS